MPTFNQNNVPGVQLIDPATGLPYAAGMGSVSANTTTINTTANPVPMRLQDGIGTSLVTVAALHSADNQPTASFANGLLTGGVAQLKNVSGNLDRQTETGLDGIPALGIATGTQQLATPFSTTTGGSIILNVAPQANTPVAMSGTVNGVPWAIMVGTILTVDAGVNQCVVVVTSVTATTFSAVFAKNHVANVALSGFVYNQARDGTAQDGQVAGLSAGATYLFNSAANGAAGGWERERSASGELDNASGAGTAVAAEYEWNGKSYDRARGVQAKGLSAVNAITGGGGAASTSITVTSTPTALLPGVPVFIYNTGVFVEQVYTSQTYVAGANPIVLAVATVTGGNQVRYEQFSANGPGLNGFAASGMGIEEEALYDPVTNLFYIERAATQDSMPAANIVAENGVLWNNVSFDRMRANLGVTLYSSAAQTTTITSSDQLNVNGHFLHVILNVTSAGTGSVTLSINGKDPASGVYYPLLTGSAVTANSTNVYRIGPALAAVANTSADDIVPRVFQVVVTANNANPMTYSLGYNLNE